jgi:hypothetical protein
MGPANGPDLKAALLGGWMGTLALEVARTPPNVDRPNGSRTTSGIDTIRKVAGVPVRKPDREANFA